MAFSTSRLGSYHYVLECRKFEQDVRLELLEKSKVDRSLGRTVLLLNTINIGQK